MERDRAVQASGRTRTSGFQAAQFASSAITFIKKLMTKANVPGHWSSMTEAPALSE